MLHGVGNCGAGLKSDGSVKVRPIDDMSISRINAATTALEKLKYDTLDLYYALMHNFEAKVKVRSCCLGQVPVSLLWLSPRSA